VVRRLEPAKILERPKWLAANIATPADMDLARPLLERRGGADLGT
jgi:hypothetical protein